MMWVVYNKDTAAIYGKFYSKKLAKEFVKYDLYWAAGKDISFDKVDMMKFDKWKMWSILGGKGRV